MKWKPNYEKQKHGCNTHLHLPLIKKASEKLPNSALSVSNYSLYTRFLAKTVCKNSKNGMEKHGAKKTD